MSEIRFVTGSGTGIGKTWWCVRRIVQARGQGRDIRALKPVVSGLDEGAVADSDSGCLLAALGEAVTPEAVARISPWRFTAPLSPDMAAARERRAIPFDEVVTFCRAAVASAQADGADLLIEGIGGVMVPLDARHTVADLVADLRIPAVLIGGSYLGALSHTLTAWESLRGRGIEVAEIVVNETLGSDVPLDETAATLARITGGGNVSIARRRG